MEIVKDKVEERGNAKERETLVSSIRNVMANLKFTLEQAMDVLSIPQAQRQSYAGLVQQGLYDLTEARTQPPGYTPGGPVHSKKTCHFGTPRWSGGA